MTQAAVRWHDLDVEDIERHFNPRVAVSDAAKRISAWTARSRALVDRIEIMPDLRYGAGAKMTFDLHIAGADLPTVIFVHGGYWRALDKADQVFVAEGWRGCGLNVANLNYDLCPTVSLMALNDEIAAAIRHITGQAVNLGLGNGSFFLAGHSCGAHAAALAAATHPLVDRLTGIVVLSGIYDTRALVHTTINHDLRLDEADAASLNALAMPPRVGLRILCMVGGDEPAAWIGESVAYCAHARSAGTDCRLEILAGKDHFSMLEACCDPGSAACRTVVEFIREAHTPR
jgi:arylformamidase